MKTVLAVLGDYWHKPEWARASIQEAFKTEIGNQQLHLRYADSETLLTELKKRPDLVIFYKDNKVNPVERPDDLWMYDELYEEIIRYVEEGGKWFAWHSGLAGYNNARYLDMVGGSFQYHPEQNQVSYYIASASETNADPVLDIKDEHYFVDCNISITNVFLYAQSEAGRSPAGWTHRYGKGAVCCLTPAHNEGNLLNPQFIRLLKNTITEHLLQI